MFDVTDTYKTLIKQPTRYVGISGAVKLRSGTVVQFTDKNIVPGSLSITDRLNRRGDFRPGGVYSSGLSIGFTGLFARTNDLDGAVIKLNYLIYPNAEMKASEAHTVPLGRFYVDGSTIKRSGSTVRLKADDGLMLFDVPTTERSGTLYELVTGACAAAGVGFAMSQEEFEALPNAALSAAINTARIQNERDLLMYVGMITGSFARITRSALALEFVPLTCEKDDSTHMIIPVREIAGNIRFTTDFSDDTTRIAKLIMRRNGTALTSTLSVTIGGSEKLATLELDENPLMSAMSDSDVKTALNAILTQLFPCLNRVFNVEFTGDPALEVGDYVRLRGGEIDTDRGYATGMITSQTWTYHGTHRIKCSMPPSLVYSGDAETAAVMALADDEETATTTAERVQPKSQIEKQVDELRKELSNSGGVAEKLQTSGSTVSVDTAKNPYNYSYTGVNILVNDVTITRLGFKQNSIDIYGVSGSATTGYELYMESGYGIALSVDPSSASARNSNFINIMESSGILAYVNCNYGKIELETSGGAKISVSHYTNGSSFAICDGVNTLAGDSTGLYYNGKKVLTEE